MGWDESTCWTMVGGAAAGDNDARTELARLYAPVIRAYFGARWRGRPLRSDVEDALQETFVDLFRENGALARADADRPGGFKAFLSGILRNVALRHETRRARRKERNPPTEWDLPGDEETASQAFEKSWALRLLEEARRRHATRASIEGDEALRRVELLRLRFDDGLPIRDIARSWGRDAALVHRDYAKARKEFLAALHQAVGFHMPNAGAGAVEEECARIIGVFS